MLLVTAIAGFHEGAVLLGNAIAGGACRTHCNGGFQVVSVFGECNCRLLASRWCWVADGGAVLLGNAIADC